MKTFETTVRIEGDKCHIYLPHMRELAEGKEAARTVFFQSVELPKIGFIAVDFDEEDRVVGVQLSGFKYQADDA